MNKLEQEMFFALYGFNSTSVPNEFKEELESVAKNAASVAVQYIYKALTYGYHVAKDEERGIRSNGYGTRFFEENGIIE